MEEFEAVTLRQFNTDSTSTMKARLSQLLSVSSKIAELYDPSKLKQFSLDQIEYISDLGEGQFGLVFKGILKVVTAPRSPLQNDPSLSTLM